MTKHLQHVQTVTSL